MPVQFEIDNMLLKEKQIYDFDVFTVIDIKAKNTPESNRNLRSIWREIDENIARDGHSRCEWMFIPKRKISNGKSFVFLGFTATRYGKIAWVCTYTQKGCLDQIAFFICDSQYQHLKDDICQLVRNGVIRKDELLDYHSTVNLFGYYQGKAYNIGDYIGDNFAIINSDSNCILLVKKRAYHDIDFANRVGELLPMISAILTSSTNTYVEYEQLECFRGIPTIEADCEITSEFQNADFMDEIPVNAEYEILLPQAVITLIDLLVSQDEIDKNLMDLVGSAILIQEGLANEREIDSETQIMTELQTYRVVKTNDRGRAFYPTTAIGLYMSAIENLTVEDSSRETCPCCGQVKYGITQRVGDIAEKYLNEDMKTLFKKIYSKRSKYFHTAKPMASYKRVAPSPIMDATEDLGFGINGFSSTIINDESYLYSCSNVREWCTFIWRKEVVKRITQYLAETSC